MSKYKPFVYPNKLRANDFSDSDSDIDFDSDSDSGYGSESCCFTDMPNGKFKYTVVDYSGSDDSSGSDSDLLEITKSKRKARKLSPKDLTVSSYITLGDDTDSESEDSEILHRSKSLETLYTEQNWSDQEFSSPEN